MPSSRIVLSAGLGSLLLAVIATPAAALQGQGAVTAASRTQQPGEIVVTHQTWPRDAFTDFVDDVTADVNGQIAMFRAPICPFVDGFADSQNKQIEQRIRRIAQEIGLPAAKDKCSPNVVVMVAKDAAVRLRNLERKNPILFQGILPSEVRGLMRQKGPVWTWQTILENSADGRSAPSSSDYETSSSGASGAAGGGGGASSQFESNLGVFRTTIQSRVRKTTRPDLFASFIMIDFDELAGLTPTQVADYATIRTLARTQPKATVQQRTMLRLLDVPRERRAELDQLTAWDIAYLQALYKSNNAVSATLQKSVITAQMRRRFAPGSTVAQPAPRPRDGQN